MCVCVCVCVSVCVYTPLDKNIRPHSKMKKKVLFTIFRFGLCSLSNGISTLVGFIIPKPRRIVAVLFNP